MGRYSPTVLPEEGPDFQTTLGRALAHMRQRELDERYEEELARERELEDVELYERGYRRFEEAPTVEQRVERPDVTRGAPIGRQATDARPPLFEDARIGLQGTSSPNALGRALGYQRGPSPGAFDPRTGTFALPGQGGPPETVGQIGLGRPTTREAPDPRYSRVAGSIYRDELENPEARAEAAAREREGMLASAIAELRGMDPARAEAAARAMGLGLPASMVLQEEEEEQGFTPEELLSAGVAEEDLGAALRDPILARELVRAANRPPPRGPDPYGGRSREQYFADLTESERIRAAARPRSSSAAADRGDPRFTERRKAIVSQIGEPTTPPRQAALDALAAGQSPQAILDRMWELGYPEDEIADVEDYIMFFGGD